MGHFFYERIQQLYLPFFSLMYTYQVLIYFTYLCTKSASYNDTGYCVVLNIIETYFLMSDIINILPDSVANQIAAGEVVDRPASAVKELLENAIDADAENIQLIVKDSGRTLIQVIDDGCGMSDSDARLCFERHATSKINKADDLFAIRTMGFRGEALASIAAVAQVELKTRQSGNELGTMVRIEASSVKEQTPCTCNQGTSISVKNLFFNIPARRNFLKKDSVELSHIEEVFRRVALVHNELTFQFFNNGKLLYDLKPGNFAQRIAGVFGRGAQERLYHIEEQSNVVNVEGYVGKVEYAKRTRNEQYIFVNNRFIKHHALSTAIERAYSELIPERTYPSFFVKLDLDPSRIDVNIHPTKTEVRFIDEQLIFSILRSATKKALGQFSLANELEFNPSTEIDFSPMGKGYTPPTPRVSYTPGYNPFNANQKHTTSNDRPSLEDYRNFFGDNDNNIPTDERRNSGIDNIDTSSANTATPINYLNRYIVTSLKSGIIVIDSQRATERIVYEHLINNLGKVTQQGQQLLFPVSCRFNASDSEAMREIMPELEKIGFAISPLGQNTFVVTAAPPDVKDYDLQNVLELVVTEYKGGLMNNALDRKNVVCMSLAKHAAKQANPMRTEDMQTLIANLFSCHAPDVSPSNKKTMFIMSERDLTEKLK